MDSDRMKGRVRALGADICGIASVDRFEGAPKGFHPVDVFPDCRSVLVFGTRFPAGPLKAAGNSPYTFVRNMSVERTDRIAFTLCCDLDREGVAAVPIPSAEPYDYWDSGRRHGRGILSLKHAGHLAGLGVLGKNTLLINERYGNMIWLGAVLLDVDLKPDPMPSASSCPDRCRVCLDSCPQNALNGITIDQKLCRGHSITCTDGGGFVLSCNICRTVCPFAGV